MNADAKRFLLFIYCVTRYFTN